MSGPDAVAHRVVHAGERFSAPAQLDDAVLSAIAEVAPLAPLHNEPAIAAIRARRRALGGADALVFGGGIGERSSTVRARICDGMAWCGLVLDDARNTTALGCDARISGDGSKPSAWVVAVDEASVIATDALACLERTSH